MVKTEKHLTRN